MSDLIRSQVKITQEGSGRGCSLHSALTLEEMPTSEGPNIGGVEDKFFTQSGQKKE